MKNILKAGLFAAIILLWQNTNAQTPANWQLVGPINFPTNTIGQINGMGRVVQIKYDPVTPNKAYAVSVSGLFVTTDNCESWTAITGVNNIPLSNTASVCIDRTNTNTIYLGTGDPNYYSTSRASGVWKSTDGGLNFTKVNTGMGNVLVLNIVQSPTDANTFIAATTSGIWKTTNAATTWTQTFATTEITGFAANTAINSQILYFSKGVQNGNGQFYTSADFGSTWNINPTFTTPALAYRGSRISVTAANPNAVYVTFIGKGGGGPGAVVTGGAIIYKSTDGGATFNLQKDDVLPNLFGYKLAEGGQGNYNFDVAVSPVDENLLIASGHLIWKSTNGGVSWTQMQTSWSVEIHTDMHHTVFDQANPAYMFNCNDGGVWKSLDGGDTWTPKCQNLVSTEFYHAANSHFNAGLIGGGTQDNGELYFRNNIWYCNRGGDFTSFYTFDNNPALPGKAYYMSRGQARDLINSPTTSRDLNIPFLDTIDDKYSFSMQNINIGFVKHNFVNAGGDVTGVGGIYRSDNIQTLTAGNPTWTKIVGQADAISIFNMKVHPWNHDTIYYVFRDKSVNRVINASTATSTATATVELVKAGTYFAGAAFNNLGSTISVADIAVLKDGVLYMSLNGTVVRSVDKGANWTLWNGTAGGGYVAIPSNINLLKLVHDSTQNNESIYALSNIGLYYRNNTMPGWLLFMDNLPQTPRLTDMDIYNDPITPSNNRLRLATYGRGLWETLPSVTTGALPVTFLGLSANAENGYNKLVWKTAQQINSRNFEIEVSFDGRNFKAINVIAAAGNSAAALSYSFNDYAVMPGITSFYRIKLNDVDGKFTYSNVAVVFVKPNNQNTISVLNNPVAGSNVNVLINATTEQNAELIILDMMGRKLLSKKIQLNKGGQVFIINDVVNIAGIYVVEVILQDGSVIQNKMLKQ
jgi:hypothetical protein